MNQDKLQEVSQMVFKLSDSDSEGEPKPKGRGRGKAAKTGGPAKPKKVAAPKAAGAKAGPKSSKAVAAKPKPKASSPKKKGRKDSDSEEDMFSGLSSGKKATSEDDQFDDSFEIQPRSGRAKKAVKYDFSSDDDSS